MPTLIELLNQIKTNPKFIKIVDGQDFTFYRFYTIYWVENNTIKSASVCIYIIDRDKPTESAYFKDAVPFIIYTPVQTQGEKLLADVKVKISDVTIADPTIEKVNITYSNDTVVEATAYKYDQPSDKVTKIYVVFYYKNDVLIWRKIA